MHLYALLSPGQGFAAILGVTLLAVALSLRNVAPIAMMGLVGGYLTPWLMLAVAYQAIGLWRDQALIHVGLAHPAFGRERGRYSWSMPRN